MNARRALRAAVTGGLLVSGLGAAAPAAGPDMVALGQIEHGQWLLREEGKVNGGEKSLCVTDPAALLQLRHGAAQCTRFVINDDPRALTVHYTCPGAGYGRTTVTVETPRLVRIDTQGLVEGAPFQLSYEARRTGSCTGIAGKQH